MKENPNNRALLKRLFGEEWLKKRDEALKKMMSIKQSKQLKLWT